LPASLEVVGGVTQVCPGLYVVAPAANWCGACLGQKKPKISIMEEVSRSIPTFDIWVWEGGIMFATCELDGCLFFFMMDRLIQCQNVKSLPRGYFQFVSTAFD